MNSQPTLTLQLKPHTTYCGICGDSITNPSTPLRRKWSHLHADTHSDHEHKMFAASPYQIYPEAAIKLAHTVIPVTDLALNGEVQDALSKAP